MAFEVERTVEGVVDVADVGDITALANPEIVEQIRHYVQSEKPSRREVPRDLMPAEVAEIKTLGHV